MIIDFKQALFDYLDEAEKYHYSNCVVNMDLDRMFLQWESDIRQDERDDVLAEVRERMEDARNCLGELDDYLDFD